MVPQSDAGFQFTPTRRTNMSSGRMDGWMDGGVLVLGRDKGDTNLTG